VRLSSPCRELAQKLYLLERDAAKLFHCCMPEDFHNIMQWLKVNLKFIDATDLISFLISLDIP
jgi:hypothetical protein